MRYGEKWQVRGAGRIYHCAIPIHRLISGRPNAGNLADDVIVRPEANRISTLTMLWRRATENGRPCFFLGESTEGDYGHLASALA